MQVAGSQPKDPGRAAVLMVLPLSKGYTCITQVLCFLSPAAAAAALLALLYLILLRMVNVRREAHCRGGAPTRDLQNHALSVCIIPGLSAIGRPYFHRADLQNGSGRASGYMRRSAANIHDSREELQARNTRPSASLWIAFV